MKTNYHFIEENEVYSPQLVYYPDLIQKNIELMIKIADDVDRLWPHIKTYKIPQIVKMLMDNGIKKVKCATIAEAEMALETGIDTIFLAYPLVGPNIDRFISLCKHYNEKTIYACGDNIKQIELLNKKASNNNIEIKVLMDVDAGQHRTGVPMNDVESAFKEWNELSNIKICGLHVYDGHRHESDEKTRYEETEKLDNVIKQIKANLINDGYECDVMIMGGTPSFPCHQHFTNFFLSPGTCIIQDNGYQSNYLDLPFTPAATILTRVISRPTNNTFTIDLGTKAISCDPAIRCVIDSMEYAKIIIHNEEHMVLEVDDEHIKDIPKIGDVLYAIPTHVCPTSVLYPSVKVVKDGHMIDEWKIVARDRFINY